MKTYGYGMIRLDRAIDGRKTLAADAEVGVALSEHDVLEPAAHHGRRFQQDRRQAT